MFKKSLRLLLLILAVLIPVCLVFRTSALTSASTVGEANDNIIHPKVVDVKALYYEKISIPATEASIEKEKWEPLVYLKRDSGGKTAGPLGFKLYDNNHAVIADTQAARIACFFPGPKMDRSIFINEPMKLLDVYAVDNDNLYALGEMNGLQLRLIRGNTVQKLQTGFTGLSANKYKKARLFDGKVIITFNNNITCYYDLKNLNQKKYNPFGFFINGRVLIDTRTGKNFDINFASYDFTYPLGRDKDGNIYIVGYRNLQKDFLHKPEQYLLVLNTSKSEENIIKLKYTPPYYSSLDLDSSGRLFQMLVDYNKVYIERLQLSDSSGKSIKIDSEESGKIEKLQPQVKPISVSFINSKTGYMSAYYIDKTSDETKGPGLLHTNDGGNTWTKISSGRELSKLKFISDTTGYALDSGDGLLLKTTDGGLNWETVLFNGIGNCMGICYLNEKVFFTKVWSKVYRTTDGGISWSKIPLPNDNGFDYGSDMCWVSSDEGYYLLCDQPGAGSQRKTLYRTMDGGKSWVVQSKTGGFGEEIDTKSGLPLGGYGLGIWFFSNGTGYIGESRGFIFKTTDKGKTFHPLKIADYQDTNLVPDFINENEGFVIGGSGNLLHTVDGGETCKTIFSPGIPHISVGPVAFSSENSGYGIIDYPDEGLYAASTEDGGKTWTKLCKLEHNITYMTIQYNKIVWAISNKDSGSEYDAELIMSTDGCHSWKPVMLLKGIGGSISFPAKDTGYVEDTFSNLYKTTDGGKTWTQIPQQMNTWHISFTNESCGLALAEDSKIVHTIDGANTWKPLELEGSKINSLTGIGIDKEKKLFLYGHSKGKFTFLHELNDWILSSIVYPEGSFDYVNVVDSNTIYAVSNSVLYKSLDGGKNFLIFSIMPNELN